MQLRPFRPGAASQTLRRLLVPLFSAAALTVALGAGCGGVSRSTPSVGGESHFLHWCNGSCEEQGLECISGLCTQPCLVAEANACSAHPGASCTDQSIEPGAVAVCDVACRRDGDCTALGAEFACDGAFCRIPQALLPSDPPDAGRLSTSGDLGLAGSTGSANTSGASSSPPSCEPCLSLAGLNWVDYHRAMRIDPWPSSELSACGDYSHELTLDVGTLQPLPRCSASIDCRSAELTALAAIVMDPAFLPFANQPGRWDYGLLGATTAIAILLPIAPHDPSEPYDPNGHVIIVGDACDGTTADCIDAPPIVGALVRQLKAIDALQLREPACAEAFPDGG